MTTRIVIAYDKARTTPEVEANFLEYLKRSYNREPLQFLIAVETDFKTEQDPKTKRMSAKIIIDNYIKDGSPLEINIDNGTKYKLLKEAEDQHDDKKLDALFDDAHKLVSAELKADSFTRYLDSDTFKEFVKKKGTKYINALVAASEKKQISFSPFDVNGAIKDQDIISLLRLVEDVSDWVPLQITKKHAREKMYYSYLSKSKYPLDGKVPNQMAAKFVGVLPVSAEDALYALIDREYRNRWEPFVKLQVDLDPYKEGDYSHLVSYAELKFMPILSTRYCVGQTSVVYDTERRAYLIFSKSTTGVKIDPTKRKKPNAIPIVLASIHAIYKISDDKCRYVTLTVSCINARSDLANNASSRILFKKRGKGLFENWLKLALERKEKYGHNARPQHSPDLDTLDDYMKKYLNTEGATKTWEI
jgi:hypothetical protein